jgi:Ca2+-dependent lipid-binding protein
MPDLILHINLIEATDVPKADLIGKSDPFCVLQLSSSPQIFRTKVIDNTTHPVWKQTFTIHSRNPATDALYVQLRDDDDSSNDDQISKTKIELSKLTPETVSDLWVELTPIEGKSGGKLHIQLVLLPEGKAATFPPN